MNKFFIILFICLGFNSCENNNEIQTHIDNSKLTIIKNYDSEFEFTFKVDDSSNDKIHVISSIKNKELNTKLLYFDENLEWIDISNFSINTKNKDYKQRTNLLVEEVAKSLKEKIDLKQINIIERMTSFLPEVLFNKMGDEEYFRKTTLSIFYHLSALKSVKRAINRNTEDCKCGVYESYTKNESPFFCAEDKIVNSDIVYSLVNDMTNNKFGNKSFNPAKTFEYLEINKNKFIYSSEIDEILRIDFNNFWFNTLSIKERNQILKNNNISIEQNKLSYDLGCLTYSVLSGSQCGCCGNYSGQCNLCSLACYLHDLSCEECTPRWYCFSGCIVSQC